MMRSVDSFSPAVVTSLGICNALGMNSQEVFERLLQGDTGGMSTLTTLLPDRPCMVGQIQGELPMVPASLSQYQSRFFSIATHVCQQIESRMALVKSKFGARRIGVVLGSSTSGIQSGEEAYASRAAGGGFPKTFHYVQQEMGALSNFVRDYFELEGPAYTISTACTSSAKALIAANRLLATGSCDAVLTGGLDSLCKLTTRGFDSLGLVADSLCNPFSANRKGLNLGEGACFMVMERLDQVAEGAYVGLTGFGESSDAYHMSAPHPEGKGAAEAISQAVALAGIHTNELLYVNAHGTGTLHNDSAEAAAIARVLGHEVPVSSSKPMTGHVLGGAGATEAGFCVLVLEQAGDSLSLPPHQWDGIEDEEMPRLRFVVPDELYPVHGNAGVLSTSFAFGGSNAALLFQRVRR